MHMATSMRETRSVSFILGFCTSFRSVTSSLRRPFPLAYAVGHATTFAVNAALSGVARLSAARGRP